MIESKKERKNRCVLSLSVDVTNANDAWLNENEAEQLESNRGKKNKRKNMKMTRVRALNETKKGNK